MKNQKCYALQVRNNKAKELKGKRKEKLAMVVCWFLSLGLISMFFWAIFLAPIQN